MRALVSWLLAAVLAGCGPSSGDPEPEAAPSAAGGTGTTYKVYFLGGQSNMAGFGFVSELPEGIAQAAAGVPIFHGKSVADGQDGGGVGVWTSLAPGHGTGFDTDGGSNTLSDRFGPEMSFAATMGTGDPIAIIKFARNGTALVDAVARSGSWDPDYAKRNRRNQYDNALTAIDHAFRARDIDGDGRVDRLVPAGIVWMQGESDAAHSAEVAQSYEANLTRLMGLLRAALRDDDLPIVLGRIVDSGTTPANFKMAHGPVVQAAQAAFAARDRCAALVDVTTDIAFLEDGWHYRSASYVALGEAFANTMRELEARC